MNVNNWPLSHSLRPHLQKPLHPRKTSPQSLEPNWSLISINTSLPGCSSPAMCWLLHSTSISFPSYSSSPALPAFQDLLHSLVPCHVPVSPFSCLLLTPCRIPAPTTALPYHKSWCKWESSQKKIFMLKLWHYYIQTPQPHHFLLYLLLLFFKTFICSN